MLRRELALRDEGMPEDDLIEIVLCRYVQDQLESRPLREMCDEEELTLEFKGGPKTTAPRDMLLHCGIIDN
jgi:hypothetical protein